MLIVVDGASCSGVRSLHVNRSRQQARNSPTDKPVHQVGIMRARGDLRCFCAG